MPRGDAALAAAVQLVDDFRAAQANVDLAQWELDMLKEGTKAAEAAAKKLASEAKAAQAFWGEEWGRGGKGGRPGACFRPRDAFANATAALEARVKKERGAQEEAAAALVARLKARRDRLTTFADGRFPGGSVETLDVDGRDVWGRTPLHWAAARGKELLMDVWGDQQSSNGGGGGGGGGAGGAGGGGGGGDPPSTRRREAGASAAAWGELVEALLSRGAPPNACDADGRTPLDLAVASGASRSAQALLAAGASVAGTANRWGQSVADVADAVGAGPALRSVLGLGPRRVRGAARNGTGTRGGWRTAGGGGGGSVDDEEEEDELLGFLAEMSAVEVQS